MDASRVQTIIEVCLKNLTVSCSRIDVSNDHPHPVFVIRTSDSGLLIGPNGENLRAFNVVIRRIAERQLGAEQAIFMVDVNGYYSRKVREIKQQAKLLADRARVFKSDIEMSPMNSYERMIVHSLLADDSEVFTESRGEGRLRRVFIRYRTADKNKLTSDSALLAN